MSDHLPMPTAPTASRRFTFGEYARTSLEELDAFDSGHSLIAFHGDGLEFVYTKTVLGCWSPQAHRAIRPEVLARYPVAERRRRDEAEQ